MRFAALSLKVTVGVIASLLFAAALVGYVNKRPKKARPWFLAVHNGLNLFNFTR
jgi:hypothetical protein